MAPSPKVFKVINLSVGCLATLSSLAQLTYIFENLNLVFLAAYTLALSVPIVYLEFRALPTLCNYASFYYSFLGRGLLYILLSLILFHGGILKVLSSVYLFFAGSGMLMCHFIPGIEEPENFKAGAAGSGLSLSHPFGVNGMVDDDDDDEVI